MSPGAPLPPLISSLSSICPSLFYPRPSRQFYPLPVLITLESNGNKASNTGSYHFYGPSLCAQCCSKCITYINAFSSHSSSTGCILGPILQMRDLRLTAGSRVGIKPRQYGSRVHALTSYMCCCLSHLCVQRSSSFPLTSQV